VLGLGRLRRWAARRGKGRCGWATRLGGELGHRKRAGRLGQEKKSEEGERFWPKRERMLSQI
jgi:hypothetical protein